MFELAKEFPSIWLMIFDAFTRHDPEPKPDKKKRPADYLRQELSPHLQHDLGLYDVDHRRHRMR